MRDTPQTTSIRPRSLNLSPSRVCLCFIWASGLCPRQGGKPSQRPGESRGVSDCLWREFLCVFEFVCSVGGHAPSSPGPARRPDMSRQEPAIFCACKRGSENSAQRSITSAVTADSGQVSVPARPPRVGGHPEGCFG